MSKKVDTVQHKYVWQGGRLVSEYFPGTKMEFFYDESGRPYGFLCTAGSAAPEMYYYVTNLQGDVVAILDSAGTEVVRYTYDVWGHPLEITGSMAARIGRRNPLLYRGYYYDYETGFYYLQSRYYDPLYSRFINADSYASTGQGFIGTNMFAYCGNNPVNRIDPDGKNAEVVGWWSSTMWWICGVDGPVPIGELIFWGGIILLGGITWESSKSTPVPEISADTQEDIVASPPSPNHNNDDEDDDDYYDDESNFGGRKQIGKSKGKAPRNNRKQNEQFNDATRGLSKDQQRRIHDKISGKGLGFHEIEEIVKDFFVWFIGLFGKEEDE